MTGPDGRYSPTPQQPQWQYPGPQYPGPEHPGPEHPGLSGQPPRRRSGIDPAKLFGIAVAGLGGLNFIFGFLPEVSAPRSGATLSVFAVGPAYVPILLLIAGLLALAAFLPGSERSRLAVAAVSVGGAVGAIVSLGTPGSFELFANPNQVSSGLGAILLVIFGIIQAVIAVGAYVVGADTLWTRRKSRAAAGPEAAPAGPASWYSAGGGPAGSGPAGSFPAGSFPAGSRQAGAQYPAQPSDVGASYGAGGWPAAQPRGAEPGWSIPGSSAGYPRPTAYGPAAQQAAAGLSAPVPPRLEEPVTGPQVVVGMETARVDITKRESAGSAPTTATSGNNQAATAIRADDVPDHSAEPADLGHSAREAVSPASPDRPAEVETPRP